AERLDVADLDGPAHVFGREAVAAQQVERQGLEHVVGGTGVDLEKGRDRTDAIAVAERDDRGVAGVRDLAARGVDVPGAGGSDAAEAETARGQFELVVLERLVRGAESRDRERRQNPKLENAHRTFPVVRR